MSTENQKSLVNTLQNLLKKQLHYARHGDISTIEALSAQSDAVVQQINREKILELNEFRTHKKQLQKAYEDLSIALKIQKDDIAEKVSRIKKGKKTIKAYKKNI
jgi:hypothetical protein